MELNTEDKQRIKQEACNQIPHGYQYWPVFIRAAEYATIYERQKLDGDSLAQHQIDYYENKLELMHRVAAEQHKDFEAERSELIEKNNSLFNACEIREKELDELRNKIQQRHDVVNGLMQKMKSTLYWHERKEEKDFLTELLNSLKK